MSNHYNEERSERAWNSYYDSSEYDADLRDLAIHRLTYEDNFANDVMSDAICDLKKEDHDMAIVDPCEFGRILSAIYLHKAMEWSEDTLANNWSELYFEGEFDHGC